MNYRIQINPVLFSTCHKYEILEEVEYIRKNDLFLGYENQVNKKKNWEKILLKEYETMRNQILLALEELSSFTLRSACTKHKSRL